MGVSRTRGSRSPGGQGMFVQYPGTCTAIFGSMTQTLHAQSSLAAASIRTAVSYSTKVCPVSCENTVEKWFGLNPTSAATICSEMPLSA